MDAKQIAEMADAGKSVSPFFTNTSGMVHPLRIQRVNVGFTLPMLEELDRAAEELNVSRRGVIEGLLRQSLDQHDLALSHQSR